jgi:hypothetical protein
MRIFGAFLIVFGLFICLSIVGAIVGIPMIIIGLVCVFAGGRPRTVVNNVVQVSHGAPPPVSVIDQSDRKSRRDIEPTFSSVSQPSPTIDNRPPFVAAIPFVPDFEVTYDEVEFTDVRTELSQDAKSVLAMAKQSGFEIRARPQSITLRKGEHSEEFRSNEALLAFGRSQGYR